MLARPLPSSHAGPTPEARALEAFQHAFGQPPALLVQAPGRVNLIGEHTDYNDGFVLPCAIGYRTAVAVSPRTDAVVRVVAVDAGRAIDEFRLDQPLAHHPRGAEGHWAWANYVRGMLQAVQQDGWPVPGLDLAIAGNVPIGAGLSSSASLQVALGQAVREVQGLAGLTPPRIAQLAQRAENHFIGVACGIMDQMVSAGGQAGHAMLLDCRSLQAEAVPLPADLAVLIAHSRVQRGLVGSAYNERRQQCEAAARHFGVPALRDLDEATLNGPRRAGLDGTAWRRARHIVTENARTLRAAEALRRGDLATLGEAMAASHASMRDDFGITTPAIDGLVAISQRVIGSAGGARMTGGGFGGCIVALLPHGLVPALQRAIARHYRGPDGSPAWVWVCEAAAGAGRVA